MIFARSGPTLTKVPVASLKSSAMRPSNFRPRWMSVSSIHFTASPVLKKPSSSKASAVSAGMRQ